MRIVSPRKSCSFSIVLGCIATTELSSLTASSTMSRLGDFFLSKIAVEKSLLAPPLLKNKITKTPNPCQNKSPIFHNEVRFRSTVKLNQRRAGRFNSRVGGFGWVRHLPVLRLLCAFDLRGEDENKANAERTEESRSLGSDIYCLAVHGFLYSQGVLLLFI